MESSNQCTREFVSRRSYDWTWDTIGMQKPTRPMGIAVFRDERHRMVQYPFIVPQRHCYKIFVVVFFSFIMLQMILPSRYMFIPWSWATLLHISRLVYYSFCRLSCINKVNSTINSILFMNLLLFAVLLWIADCNIWI